MVEKQLSDHHRVIHEYDLRNRLTFVEYPDGTSKYYTYDPAGNLIAFGNNRFQEVREYDAGNRMISTWNPDTGKRVTYAYDLLGNRTRMIDPDNGVFTYQYDELSRLIAFTDPEGMETTYAYDSMGRLIRTDYPNNTHTVREYDTDNWLASIATISDGDGVVGSFTYTHDAVGNRLSMTDDFKTVEYLYNAANQMVQAGDTTFAYDDNGNRILKSDADGDTRYTYDFDNRLTAVVDVNGERVDYHYDALGRRASKVTGAKGNDIFTYVYDGLDVLQEVTGQNDQKITAYYHANGALVARQEYNLSKGGGDVYTARPEGRLRYYAHDGLGSVISLTSYEGEIKAQYRYDAYGNAIVGELNDTPYGFTGKRFDGESGFYHFHFRQYDPRTGVWMTKDPIGVVGGINLYGYVMNNPISFLDPIGLCEEKQVEFKGALNHWNSHTPLNHIPSQEEVEFGPYPGWGWDEYINDSGNQNVPGKEFTIQIDVVCDRPLGSLNPDPNCDFREKMFRDTGSSPGEWADM